MEKLYKVFLIENMEIDCCSISCLIKKAILLIWLEYMEVRILDRQDFWDKSEGILCLLKRAYIDDILIEFGFDTTMEWVIVPLLYNPSSNA